MGRVCGLTLDTKTYRGWIPFYNKYLLGNITGDRVLGIISSICALPVLIIGYVLFAMDELNYLFEYPQTTGE